ncbi:hypothetical protein [Paracoccus tegillarcae]|uniref:Alpha/beta hydrolase n=1 Tax=Paracoccus tegillarcae TaxID=1529068 RepID=A0A2K9EGN5_9RHOB|nr:hypothetical protein [Paracoccus tegillarcae]AUH32487.1 hypothetical protein CUV01_02975 [Paracoccus tegillarcae]
MEKTLILVVHGIGEQAPGETIDALTGGAVQELRLPGAIEGRTEMIAEPAEDSELLQLFPCTIRQTVIPASFNDTFDQDQDVLAAEVYWSDLSPAPKGPFSTAFDLLHSVLGLGYLALENVDHSDGKISPWSRRGVHAFIWIFYALLAPLNALLLVGSLSLLSDQFFFPVGQGAGKLPGALLLAMTGGLVFAGCLIWLRYKQRPRHSYMMRAFITGLGAMSALTMAAALLIWLGQDTPWIEALRLSACQSVETTACWTRDYQDVALIAWLSTLFTGLVWLVAMVILLALFMTTTLTDLGLRRTLLLFGIPIVLMVAVQVSANRTWPWLLLTALFVAVLGLALSPPARGMFRRSLDRITRFFGQRELIYQSICNAMLILWMLITAALWALFSGMVKQIGGSEADPSLLTMIYQDYSSLLTSALAYVMIAVGTLLAIGAVPVIIRGVRRKHLAQETPTGLDVWCGRLILNPVLNLLLFILILWMAFGGLFQAAVTAMTVFGEAYRDPFTGAVFLNGVNAQTGQQIWTADSAITRLSNFHTGITDLNRLALVAAGVLGLVIYRGWNFIANALGIARDISVYAARTHGAKPMDGNTSRYVQRQRILARFRLVHDHLARQMDYDRLIVVAHSQGTVIAAQSLAQNDLPDRPRVLLTMGSPLTHIYGQYFAKAFGLQPLPGRLVRWINIFRCDDFVGTRVRLDDGVIENLRVEANGHTGYWTDRNVWSALRKALAITPSDNRDSPDAPHVA